MLLKLGPRQEYTTCSCVSGKRGGLNTGIIDPVTPGYLVLITTTKSRFTFSFVRKLMTAALHYLRTIAQGFDNKDTRD
jgi:hypothetical protein